MINMIVIQMNIIDLEKKKNLDSSNSKIRKISIDFLSKLYDEGSKPYSQKGSEIEFNQKI